MPSQQAGEGHTAPCDDHEGVAADDMIELTFLTVMPDVKDTLTVSRFATIASIVLAYHDEVSYRGTGTTLYLQIDHRPHLLDVVLAVAVTKQCSGTCIDCSVCQQHLGQRG